MSLNLLGLADHLRSPRGTFSPLPLADLALILVFFALTGSALVNAPGEEIALPRDGGGSVTPALADEVATLRANGILVYRNRLLPANTSREDLVEALSPVEGANRTLLLKADRDTPLGDVLRVTDAARAAGFARVQAATAE